VIVLVAHTGRFGGVPSSVHPGGGPGSTTSAGGPMSVASSPSSPSSSGVNWCADTISVSPLLPSRRGWGWSSLLRSPGIRISGSETSPCDST
jgi:hypothetical protein